MAINGGRSLSPQGFGDPFDEVDGDGGPMAGLGNLADAMLVFACGLIVALIAHYGVDLGTSDLSNAQALNSDIAQATQEESEKAGQYDEVGSVYLDEESGTYYVVTPDGQSLDLGD